jgi:hypothetical protein
MWSEKQKNIGLMVYYGGCEWLTIHRQENKICQEMINAALKKLAVHRENA